MNKLVDADLRPDPGLTWDNRFAALGERFGTRLSPRPLPAPYRVATSRAMARELGLDDAWMAQAVATETFTGNLVPAGAQPMASVYSGHQFGVWAGQLGDGRAILLGEVRTPTGQSLELQLKGSGLTPYSRMGDGRAVLRSSIREFLCSEAMHGLGIPTTRALCVTGSDAPVRREEIETAAVVTRVAPSFIRFGHFEHFSAADDLGALRTLADYTIERYYPECRDAPNPFADLLRAVAERTAALVAQWQAVGFCHGVMNTDNMSILGLTIDYGPFGFMDAFDPDHICNHSDTSGRYSWNRQPNIAYWNLFALGQALMPLIDDQDAALAALEPYKTVFPAELDRRFNAKLGLADVRPGDREQMSALLRHLARDKVDWTIFWRRACAELPGLIDESASGASLRDLFLDREAFDAWLSGFRQHLRASGRQPDAELMRRSNPLHVLRNHLAEAAIRQARMKDFSEVERLLRVLGAPHDDHPDATAADSAFPPDWARHLEVSCSS